MLVSEIIFSSKYNVMPKLTKFLSFILTFETDPGFEENALTMSVCNPFNLQFYVYVLFKS